MSVIQIENMEFYAYHGHFREEQIVGNRFLVDLWIETDMSRPAVTDNLEDAVNYQVAYKLIRKEMEKKSNLLEHIAKRILDALFESLVGIEKVRIKISKMNPPVGGKVDSVSVSLGRTNKGEYF
ncbi:MAG: dihydroneopterin aldolase [Bacteroidetes bacterium]|nr:dihydroneopterin aldolase [Bacteroidota bacterium]